MANFKIKLDLLSMSELKDITCLIVGHYCRNSDLVFGSPFSFFTLETAWTKKWLRLIPTKSRVQLKHTG